MSPFDFKKSPCCHVQFKKRPCHPVDLGVYIHICILICLYLLSNSYFDRLPMYGKLDYISLRVTDTTKKNYSSDSNADLLPNCLAGNHFSRGLNVSLEGSE